MYCLGCKDFAHNFRPQEVKMTNKVLVERRKKKKKQKIDWRRQSD